MPRRLQIAVIGGSHPPDWALEAAHTVGRLVAEAGHILLCGGLEGVMEAAACGAKAAGGLTVGILPGNSQAQANSCIDVKICTDLGHARAQVLVWSADAIIAIDGSYGTLAELAFACVMGRPIVALRSWEGASGSAKLDFSRVSTPEEAVQKALQAALALPPEASAGIDLRKGEGYK